MRFLVDRNVDLEFARLLREAGHDVAVVGVDLPRDASDETILENELSTAHLVITNDRDFGELVVRFRLPNPGVILFRLGSVAPAHRLARFNEALGAIRDASGQLVVITPLGIRIRD